METRDRKYGMESFNSDPLNDKDIDIYVDIKQGCLPSPTGSELDLAVRRSVDEELALTDDSDDENCHASTINTRVDDLMRSQTSDKQLNVEINNLSSTKRTNHEYSEDSESDSDHLPSTQHNAEEEDDEEDSDEDLRLNRIINEHSEGAVNGISIPGNIQVRNSKPSGQRSRSSSRSSCSNLSTDSDEHAQNSSDSNTSCCPFTCHYCSKIFRSSSDVRRHERSHTGERPYPCEHCSKSFSQLSHLQRHLLTHPDKVIMHKCPHCSKTYPHKMQLLGHMSAHNKKEKVKKEKPSYKCSFCQKEFDTHRRYRIHYAAHTNRNLHCCDVCGRTFKMKSYLIVHQRTHTQTKVYTGDRPFACKVCGKAFLSSSNLDLHSSIHTFEKTSFSCEICGKEFSRKSNYVAHAKSHYR